MAKKVIRNFCRETWNFFSKNVIQKSLVRQKNFRPPQTRRQVSATARTPSALEVRAFAGTNADPFLVDSTGAETTIRSSSLTRNRIDYHQNRLPLRNNHNYVTSTQRN